MEIVQMRDNFSEATKKLLADRAGRKCSNPYCRRTTIGPQLGDKGTVNIGEAAHIYAASPGGPQNKDQVMKTEYGCVGHMLHLLTEMKSILQLKC